MIHIFYYLLSRDFEVYKSVLEIGIYFGIGIFEISGYGLNYYLKCTEFDFMTASLREVKLRLPKPPRLYVCTW